ncbi:MAG: hypothetical protein KDC87_03190 [Planctomycetes bacterium]|nr:hypothetical protein [Planctomycetota bacterium]
MLPHDDARHRSPTDPRDLDLFAQLERIDDRMAALCARGGVTDPDEVMAELDADTSRLSECIEKLMRDIDGHSHRRAQINRLVDVARRELLLTSTWPVVVRTSTDPLVPDLALAEDLVLAVVHRALKLCLRHLGAGSELTVTTSAARRDACIRVEGRSAGRIADPSLDIKLHSMTLADLVFGIGGDLRIEQEAERLVVTMRLVDDIAHGSAAP